MPRSSRSTSGCREEAGMPIVHAGGAQLEVEQSGSGPDLLLLHSLLTDPGSFSPIVPALSRTRRATPRSLPGFCRSTPAPPPDEAFGALTSPRGCSLGL